MIRYREIYTKMAEAVVECRKEGADVLVGGGDSNSNALDKFFADGQWICFLYSIFCLFIIKEWNLL